MSPTTHTQIAPLPVIPSHGPVRPCLDDDRRRLRRPASATLRRRQQVDVSSCALFAFSSSTINNKKKAPRPPHPLACLPCGPQHWHAGPTCALVVDGAGCDSNQFLSINEIEVGDLGIDLLFDYRNIVPSPPTDRPPTDGQPALRISLINHPIAAPPHSPRTRETGSRRVARGRSRV